MDRESGAHTVRFTAQSHIHKHDPGSMLLGHRDGTAMMVNKDSSIFRIEDLRGKKVAVPNRYSNPSGPMRPAPAFLPRALLNVCTPFSIP